MAQDFSKMSDAELEAIASGKPAKQDFSKMSDADLEAIASGKTPGQPSYGEDLTTLVQKHGSLGMGPFAAGVGGGLGKSIGTLQRGDIGFADRLKALPEAFQSGFGEARQENLAKEQGASERHPGLDLGVGLGSAVLTAPLMAVKGLQGATAMGRIGSAARVGGILGGTHALGHAESTGEALKDIGTGAAMGGAVQGLFEIPGKVVSGLKKLASTTTKVPEAEISAYANRAGDINKIIKESGGNISEASDSFRRGIQNDLQATRRGLNSEIDKALSDPVLQSKMVDGRPVLQKLQNQFDRLYSNEATRSFKANELNELAKVVDSTQKAMGQNGEISLSTLYQLKRELQTIASPSYQNGQQIFPRGDLAEKAAKDAAATARSLFQLHAKEAGDVSISRADAILSKLHQTEKLMNKNLISPGKPEAALLAAGSGGNERNRTILESLGQLTGKNYVQGAENLAAARTFQNPSMLNLETTGKAVLRSAVGGGIGYGIGGEKGAAAGAMLSSPMGLKVGLDALRLGSRGASAIGLNNLGNMVASPQGRSAIINLATGSAMDRRRQQLQGR